MLTAKLGQHRGVTADDLIELGKLVRRHGVRGELRLLPFNPGSPALEALGDVALCGEGGTPRWIRVSGSRRHKSFVLVRFEGVDGADAADELVGSTVAIRRSQLPPLEDGEVYHFELLGRAVSTEAGERIGIVEEIMPTGSNDVLVVREGDRESLIPWIDDVVIDPGTDGADIVIRPLPGLLDP
jgi:16S rRNA processing protein RimM